MLCVIGTTCSDYYASIDTGQLGQLLRSMEQSRMALKQLDADIKKAVEGSSWWRAGLAAAAAVVVSSAAAVVFAPFVWVVGGVGMAYVYLKTRQFLGAVLGELRHGTLGQH